MITTFRDTPQLAVMRQALLLTRFDDVKAMFLAGLPAMGLSTEQQLAMRLAAASIAFHGPSPGGVDKLLMTILRMDWASVSANGVEALSDEQRASIVEGIMIVCRSIIDTQVTKLQELSALVTTLPQDWNTPDEDPEPEPNPED